MILTFLLLTLLSTSVVAQPIKNSNSYNWINEQGTTITPNGDGFNFEASTRNSSAKLNQQVLLDGLSFDYKILNAQSGQRGGFYFNNDSSHSLDNNTCTFTFAPSFTSGGAQTRFGIYPTDATDKWFQVKNYPLNQISIVGKTGFGLDHTLVMNSNVNLALNFTFKLVGPFYKITIRQLNTDLIWPTNANYTSDSKGDYVTTYVEATNISTNNGYVYFHEFGYTTTVTPTIYIGNIHEEEQDTVTVTYHYNQFVNNGTTSVPVVEEITVDINTLLEQPTTPDNPGYFFAGWYSDAFFNSKWDFENDYVINDLHLYAKWVTDESEINPKANNGKIVDRVIQLSMPAFISLCVIGGLLLIPLGFLIAYLIKKIILKNRGNKLLK